MPSPESEASIVTESSASIRSMVIDALPFCSTSLESFKNSGSRSVATRESFSLDAYFWLGAAIPHAWFCHMHSRSTTFPCSSLIGR